MSTEPQNTTLESRRRRRPRWAKAFIAALRQTGNATRAAEAAHTDRSTAYRYRNEDPEFRIEWDDACEESADLLELEARRRAVEGVERVIYYQGEEVGRELIFSDALLALLLKANRPEKFRERSEIAHTGPAGGPLAGLTIDMEALGNLGQEELDALDFILAKLAGPPAPDSGA